MNPAAADAVAEISIIHMLKADPLRASLGLKREQQMGQLTKTITETYTLEELAEMAISRNLVDALAIGSDGIDIRAGGISVSLQPRSAGTLLRAMIRAFDSALVARTQPDRTIAV